MRRTPRSCDLLRAVVAMLAFDRPSAFVLPLADAWHANRGSGTGQWRPVSEALSTNDRSITSSTSSSHQQSSVLAAGRTPESPGTRRLEGWNPQPGVEIGTVSLVGSGPGDPDLLTIAGLRELQSADMVIADRLVSPEILGLVKGDLRVARKYPGCAEKAQREIYRWMREGLSEGKHVVRLKIGDPFVFGRGAEEVLEMRELGVEAKVVPGISSVFSAPLLGGIPVTHRGAATQVTLGTAYGKDYARPDICDYHPQKTAVFLMAIGRLEELCADLQRRGYPMDCPMAIVENASTPRQRVVAGTVKTITKIARDLEVKAPATMVVGEVVATLHGRKEGLISDAAEGMFAGVDSEKVARAAQRAKAAAAQATVDSEAEQTSQVALRVFE